MFHFFRGKAAAFIAALRFHQLINPAVPHGGQGMVLHMALMEGNIVDQEHSVFHRSPIDRKSGAKQCVRGLHKVH